MASQKSAPHVDSTYVNPFEYLNEVGSSELIESMASASVTPNPENGGLGAGPTFLSEESAAARAERIEALYGTAAKHPLPKAWTFWYLKPPTGSKSNFTNYESLLKKLGDVDTVEDFWALYLSLKRPSELQQQPGTTDYSVFMKGVDPTWEDENNSDGGKLMLRLKKHNDIPVRYYETVLLLMIGGELPDLEEVTGMVFSIRSHECILSIWTRHASNLASIQNLREFLKSYFGLPAHAVLEYKPHHYTKPTPKADAADEDV